MRANLELTEGFVMAESFKTALAASVGLQRAHEAVEAATRRALAERVSLREALASEPLVLEHLSPDALERAAEPRNYLGVAGEFVRRALAEEGSA
jgi:3-carboxy-cis,cis-muconate cycloisomerase